MTNISIQVNVTATLDELARFLRQQEGKSPSELDMSLSVLDVRNGTKNKLTFHGIKTIGQLVSLTESELLGVRGFGAVRMREVISALDSRGLSLRAYEKSEVPSES